MGTKLVSLASVFKIIYCDLYASYRYMFIEKLQYSGRQNKLLVGYFGGCWENSLETKCPLVGETSLLRGSPVWAKNDTFVLL